MRRSSRIATLALSGGLILAPLAVFSPASAAGPIENATYSVGEYTFEVPTGITCLQFQVDGASGGTAVGGGPGGIGGRTTGWIEVAPGDDVGVSVGARGQDGSAGGAGGAGGTISIVGGDGGTYPEAYENEPMVNLVGAGGGSASLIFTFAPIAMGGGGGGGGAGYSTQGSVQGGAGGDAGDNGADGEGPDNGTGGVAGGSVSSIGQNPEVLPEGPDDDGFGFLGGGGGGGGGNGGLGGESTLIFDAESGAGGGGGGTNFLHATAIGGVESQAPEGDGQVVLTWQEGFTGECGDPWDEVDTDGDGDDGDGGSGGSNVGSTFDTGATTSDSSNVVPLIGLAAVLAAASGVALISRRRAS